MGTRTDILKIAGRLKEIAAKNPSVGLMPIVAELEAVAERADQKRMIKKKAVEDLLRGLPGGPAQLPQWGLPPGLPHHPGPVGPRPAGGVPRPQIGLPPQIGPRPQIGPPLRPSPNFLGTVVSPRITDPALKQQIADYERSIAAFVQQVERSSQSYAAAIGAFRSRWEA
jgi:hypothetical protein